MQVNRVMEVLQRVTVEAKKIVRAEKYNMTNLRDPHQGDYIGQRSRSNTDGLAKGNKELIPVDYWWFQYRLSVRFAISFLGNKVFAPAVLTEQVPKSVHFLHRGQTKVLQSVRICWSLKIRDSA